MAVASLVSFAPAAAAQTYAYVGAPQAYVVPAGVISVRISAYGGSGGAYEGGWRGGPGSFVGAVLPVTPGETLWVRAGGAGSGGLPGYNGGGAGGQGPDTKPGGGGGGASDVRRGGDTLAHRVVVAGGGGGDSGSGTGGGAGDRPGADARILMCFECGWRTQPNGGDAGPGPWSVGTSRPGAVSHHGNPLCGTSPGAGTPGEGGDGARTCDPCQIVDCFGRGSYYAGGGGGGGGYVGGGAGGTGDDNMVVNNGHGDPGGGGGGGSSYADPAATGVSFESGANDGPGYVVVEPVVSSPVTSTCTVVPSAAGVIGIVAEARAASAGAVTTTVECVASAPDGSRTVVSGSAAGPAVAAVGSRVHEPGLLTVCSNSSATWLVPSGTAAVVVRAAEEERHCQVASVR